MEGYWYLRNLQDRMADDQKQHSKNVPGKQSDGPIIPFGASVEYLPITAKDKSRTLLTLCTTSGRGGSGDLLLADCKDLQELDAAEVFCQKIQKSGSIRNTPIRVSLSEWNHHNS